MCPNNRTNIHTRYGCPVCSGQRTVKGVNDLKTWCEKNGEFGQQLLSEWTGITEDNVKVDISNINVGNKLLRMKWKCRYGHMWVTPICSRTGKYKNGCPECYNKARSEKITNAKLISGVNDLYSWCIANGSIGKLILEEYIGTDNSGNVIDMHNININSHKKVMWRCTNNHVWSTSVRARVRYGRSCPKCNIWGTSYPEQFIYRVFKQIYPKTINRGKFQGYEFDIAIPDIKVCIEYSSMYYHKDKLDRDTHKKNICNKYNVRFIQIYAHSGELDTKDIFTEDLIIYKVPVLFEKHTLQLNKIAYYILNILNCDEDDVDLESAHTEAYNFMHKINKEVTI